MNKKILLIFAVVLLVSMSYSVFGSTTWAEIFAGHNNYISSAQQTSDGGYIVAGSVYDVGSYVDISLIKLDSNGNKIWAKTFGRNFNDYAYSVQQTSDGGYIVAGSSGSAGYYYDVFIIKLDSNGNKIWAKYFDANSYESADSVQQTSDGGYIVTGHTGNNGFNGFMMKLNSNGNKIWAKSFPVSISTVSTFGQQTSDGGYIATATTSNADILIIKLDSNGNKIWAKTFGKNGWDAPSSIQQTSDGGYIVAGYTKNYRAINSDFLIIKLDSNGNKTWAKTFGGMDFDEANSIQQTSDGGYIVAGHTNNYVARTGDILIIKLNSNGNKIWAKSFDRSNNDHSNSIQQTSDGGYIVAGASAQTVDSPKGILFKLNSLGDVYNCDIYTTVKNITLSEYTISDQTVPSGIQISPFNIQLSLFNTQPSLYILNKYEICTAPTCTNLYRIADSTKLNPSPNDYPPFSTSSGDTACCPNPTDCVYGNTCYKQDNNNGGPYNFGFTHDKKLICEATSTIPSGKGKWYDCDNSQGACIESTTTGRCGLKWVKSGQIGVGEYNTTGSEECCGDDSNEYYTTQGLGNPLCCKSSGLCVRNGNCVSKSTMKCATVKGPQGEDLAASCNKNYPNYEKVSDKACCPKNTDCVYSNACYADDLNSSSKEITINGNDLSCSSGTWCPVGFKAVEDRTTGKIVCEYIEPTCYPSPCPYDYNTPEWWADSRCVNKVNKKCCSIDKTWNNVDYYTKKDIIVY